MSIEIKLTISEELYDKSMSLIHVTNFLTRHQGEEVKMDDFARMTLVYFLERFYDNMITNASTINNLIPLGNPDLPLKINIEQHILKLGLPLTQIAKQLKISKGTLSNIIENRNQPSLDIFIRLWVLIGCPPLHEILYREME